MALDGEIGPGTRLLAVITSPTIALLQMTVGVYGLVFEFMSPGAVAPGVIGAIGLLRPRRAFARVHPLAM